MSLFTANPAAAATPTAHLRRQLIEELRFARDSPLEETGLEPSVPGQDHGRRCHPLTASAPRS
jgi:hypothetical protein